MRTRVLLPTSNGPVWGTPRDTLVKSGGRDIGPAMAARVDDVHIVTPGGGHVMSTNGGVSWKEDPMPLPPNGQAKTASVAIDPSGVVTVAFSFIVNPTANAAKNAGSGGYWQLRTIRRAKDGTWTGAADALAGLQGWTEPPPTEDALADWVRVVADLSGAIHLAWHGTGISHIYGNDLSYYAFKPANGPLQAPIALVPPDPKTGIKFSFAPGLALDNTTAFALTFYDVYDGTKWLGFDSRLLRFRNGKPEGDPIQVTDFVRRAIDSKRPADTLSSRFPAPAATVTRGPDGQVWLDILETLIPMGAPDAPKLIVYHRLDLAPKPN
ncbi:MAG TPA: hypothetical protein VKI44_17175 [Acetobacteraceae bacterium]|nr:hypothetical protein [Acetobacteraceae bacterium]